MQDPIIIDGFSINEKSRPYIVAEIGLNHNNDLNLAKDLIKKAKESGANAVKFQTYITENLLLKKEPAFKIFKDLELSKDQFKIIAQYAKQIGVTFFSTPFCFKTVDWLEELNVPCYKIASMDSDYYDFIKYIAQTGKPVILSTGMSSFGIIEKAINTIEKTGNNKIIICHTISKYPPEYSDMDMNMINKIKNTFNYPVGFSDHTQDNTMAVVARTFKAVLFEKHFTLDKNLEGPDHSISSTPSDLKDLMEKLKAVDESLIKHKVREDMKIEKGARRGLYAAGNYKKGDIITREMIKVVRPKTNIPPELLDIFIGKKIIKDLYEDEPFDLSCF